MNLPRNVIAQYSPLALRCFAGPKKLRFGGYPTLGAREEPNTTNVVFLVEITRSPSKMTFQQDVTLWMQAPSPIGCMQNLAAEMATKIPLLPQIKQNMAFSAFCNS
jgi:hypothetical protein